MALSKKNQRDVVVVAVLICVLGGVLFWLLTTLGVLGRPRLQPAIPAPQAQAHEASTMPPVPAAVASGQVGEGVVKARQSASAEPGYRAHGFRDPFKSYLPKPRPPVAASPGVERAPDMRAAPVSPPPDLHLEGVLWGGPEPKAIIDQEVYGLGDVVQGATITAIGPEGVRVEAQGRMLNITVRAETDIDQSVAPIPPAMRMRRGQQGHLGPFGGTQ